MNADDRMDQLERKLRDQAEDLFHRHGKVAPASDLLAEHGRRLHARRTATAILSIVATIAVLALFGLLRDPRSTYMPGQADKTAGSGDETIARIKRASVEKPISNVERPPAKLDHEPMPVVVGPIVKERGPMPFLIIASDRGEYRITAAGLYVPEYVEEVNLSDLSPAEQRAVRRVLGIEYEPDSDEVL